MTPATLAVVGPTACGKTALAVRLAELLAPAELVNADSRQLLHGLEVATCKPTVAELRGIRCHLLDLCEPGEPFSVAAWTAAARAVIDGLDARGVLPILVGGTGLYFEALASGLDFGAAPPDRRRRAERSEAAATGTGAEALRRELLERDPAAAGQVDLDNPRRVIRALELLDAHGGAVATARGRGAGIDMLWIGLDLPREEHERRIRRRALAMFGERDLVGEVRRARARGLDDAVLRECGIGYAEALLLADGLIDQERAVEHVVRRTLRYAKAQRTWWRSRPVRWVSQDTDAGGLADQLRAALGRPENKRLHTCAKPC